MPAPAHCARTRIGHPLIAPCGPAEALHETAPPGTPCATPPGTGWQYWQCVTLWHDSVAVSPSDSVCCDGHKVHITDWCKTTAVHQHTRRRSSSGPNLNLNGLVILVTLKVAMPATKCIRRCRFSRAGLLHRMEDTRQHGHAHPVPPSRTEHPAASTKVKVQLGCNRDQLALHIQPVTEVGTRGAVHNACRRSEAGRWGTAPACLRHAGA